MPRKKEKAPAQKNTKMGRPVEYNATYDTKVKSCLAAGASKAEAAKALGISRSTLYDWISKYPTFRESVEMGNDWGEGAWDEIIAQMAIGNPAFKNASVPAMQMLMRNRYGWDKQKDESKNTVNINSINIQQNYDKMELDNLQELLTAKLLSNNLVTDVEYEEYVENIKEIGDEEQGRAA